MCAWYNVGFRGPAGFVCSSSAYNAGRFIASAQERSLAIDTASSKARSSECSNSTASRYLLFSRKNNPANVVLYQKFDLDPCRAKTPWIPTLRNPKIMTADSAPLHICLEPHTTFPPSTFQYLPRTIPIASSPNQSQISFIQSPLQPRTMQVEVNPNEDTEWYPSPLLRRPPHRSNSNSTGTISSANTESYLKSRRILNRSSKKP
jgi:hypothetical protein